MPMKFRQSWGMVLALCLCSTTAWAANDAAVSFERARQLVAAGDLAAARKALVAAVKADRSNQQYLQQYLLVSQAIKLQQAVKTEKDPKRWEAAAQSLSLFYSSQGLHAQALPVDEAIYNRLKSADAAVQLGETMLALDEHGRAVELLRDAPQNSPASQALLCVALVRQGNTDEANQVASTLKVASDADPFTLYLAARAQAAVGDSSALATLKRCYESVPPSRLNALKNHTKQCRDFARLTSSAAFSEVLRTQSKVPESKCSGGSSCSSCPMRGNCSHGK